MQISEQSGMDPDKQTNNNQSTNPEEALKMQLQGTLLNIQQRIGTGLHIVDARTADGQGSIGAVDANGNIVNSSGTVAFQATHARGAYIVEGNSENLTGAGNSGRIQGDPHFIDMDEGYTYDIQGRDGGTYNIYSDLYFSMNARFGAWGNGATVMKEIGIVIDGLQISFDANGYVKINGKSVTPDEAKALSGGKLSINGNTIKLNHHEVDFAFTFHGNHINLTEAKVKSGVDKDTVLPHGLLGLSARPNQKGRTVHASQGRPYGAQGEGVIDGTVQDYEVDDLFETNFKYSQYYG